MKDMKTSTAQVVELPELPHHHAAAAGPTILSGNLDVIGSVKVALTVRVGEAIVSVDELMNMKDAHVLKLDAALDTPVDVLLEGKVVARGQLVAVDDNFGVRITELPKTMQAVQA
jgi:flagellar motor switch protein FliN/FliY